MSSPSEVTALLIDWSSGDHSALNRLLPLVYAALRRVAARQLRNEREDYTLQPAASDRAAADEVSILALDLALQRLAAFDRDLAKIVELRAFGGLPIDEAACVLDMSPSTAKRDCRTAKAWLGRELGLESHQ